MAKAVGIAPAMLKPGGGITTMVQAGGHPAAAGSYATLRDVITADVARLTPLIPTWPPLLHLSQRRPRPRRQHLAQQLLQLHVLAYRRTLPLPPVRQLQHRQACAAQWGV
ncbi:hypothetical protein A1F94_012947 [Pyrenophora tritici-repentis]|nr:hypothetical protein A1F94_012947 [Pyrenophora tritici-repentis]